MGRRLPESRRRPPRKAARPRLLVVCGGERTERDYFDGLRKRADNAATVVVQTHARSPQQIVGFAAKKRESASSDFDQTWCVVDVDDFDIESAVQEAGRSNGNLAISNPCFEIWLLLHFEHCRAYLANYAEVVKRLRAHAPRYDKSRLRFEDYEAGIVEAISRAKMLESSGSDCRVNPSTNVWQLVERVRGQ